MAFKKWECRQIPEDQAQLLSRECEISPFLAEVLVARGLSTPAKAAQFFGEDEPLSDPFLLADMDRAVERIQQAVEQEEKIAVYGDYDCDGVTSTAMLMSYLISVGADAMYYIPERDGEGYGLNADAVRSLAADGVTLLPCYGYRTREQSAQLFEKQVSRQLAAGLSQEAAVEEAKKWVAPPGTSDHHTGLALDIVTPEHQVLNHAFAGTPAARWMAGHSTEYGFVIRFPEDKQEITGITYEPWHLRYVGEEHARVMREQNLCLEEYWEQLYGEGQA